MRGYWYRGYWIKILPNCELYKIYIAFPGGENCVWPEEKRSYESAIKQAKKYVHGKLKKNLRNFQVSE